MPNKLKLKSRMPDMQKPGAPRAEFPTHGLLPRADTQAGEFVAKHPTFDGRGALVAVLDTGIDPGAVGLQVTSDGRRKVVDYVDCTGAGDVALEVIKGGGGGAIEIKGGSGRTLRLNAAWRNPTGEWRVGTKRLYDLVPAGVAAQIRGEREERFRTQAQALADAARARRSALEAAGDDEAGRAEAEAQDAALAALGGAYADPGPVLDAVVFHDGDQWRAAVDVDESGDLSAAAALGAYRHTGDVGMLSRRHLVRFTVNFYDGGRTLSIVSSSGEHGTHVAGIAAANHPDEPQNNGVAPGAQLLSLMIGDHRVASMETGVGLTRAINAIVEHGADLANMSFGEPTATPGVGQWVQAVQGEVVRRHRCLFVASGGNEGPALSTVGAPGGTSDGIVGVGAYAGYEQMLVDHGLYRPVDDAAFTWCSRGPAPNGAPGIDIYAPGSAVASMPAYSRQRMHMLNGTSMASPSLCGCAALLVSAWKQTFPAAAGAGAAAERISPYRLRSALERTAKPVGDELGGAGMVQTDAAWRFLRARAERPHEDVAYRLAVSDESGGGATARGVYLRGAEETAHPRALTVRATPVFPTSAAARLARDASGEAGQREAQAHFDFEHRVVLAASEPWIQAPAAVYVPSTGVVFSVCVDPTRLEPGRLHAAAIHAYDSRDVDRGPVFSVPVVVAPPLPVGPAARLPLGTLRFRPADVVRRFVAVPAGATRATITVVANAAAAAAAAPPARFVLHCLQLVPHERARTHELKKTFDVGHRSAAAGDGTAHQRFAFHMDVVGGVTLEVCLAQRWDQHGAHDVDLEVAFAGVVPAGATHVPPGPDSLRAAIALNGGCSVERADLAAWVRPERAVAPAATLTRLRRTLRPHAAAVAPLHADRDTHLATGSPIHQLRLDYRLDIKADATSLRPRLPAVDTQIYDAWADSLVLAVFDANKRCVAVQSMYTKSLTIARRGDYLIRVQIRHRCAEDLDALRDMPLVLDMALAAPIKLKTALALADLMTTTVADSPYHGSAIAKGAAMPLFFSTALPSPQPADAAPGDVLTGDLAVSKDVAKIALSYIMPPKPIPADSNKKAGAEGKGKGKGKSTVKAKNKDAELAQADKDQRDLDAALRAVRLDWVKKAKDPAFRDALVDSLAADASQDRAEVLAAQLAAIDRATDALPWSEAAGFSDESAAKAIALADEIAALTRERALTAHLYKNQDSQGSQGNQGTAGGDNNNSDDDDNEEEEEEDAAEAKKKADTAKAQLVAALTAKCRAMAFLATQGMFSDAATAGSGSAPADQAASDRTAIAAYDRAVAELTRWTAKKQQAEDLAFLLATGPLHIARGQYGRALNPVLDWLTKAPLQTANAAARRSAADLRDLLLVRLEWPQWSAHFRALAPIESPPDYDQL
ncbi:hypothetical protein H4R18_004825 [Coemansia javaensis]|uniref:Tripeptidyl-peptidase II n=1 Tax=Coemansia javaensis TaxID=2761396 RepID=A0A9W8LGC5_9FUNG|nr:hypothetical protein H4R18_004825 [Coemansia javaensis]